MIINVNLPHSPYDIHLERGILDKANILLNLNRKCLIVTDDGVPSAYSEKIASFCKYSKIITLKQGEASKNFNNFKLLCEALLEEGFTRTDCAIAVGGGVIGDITGFAAASYMRGIDFYNIPTTLLSQVDSSIGGKVAINLNNIKNIVGSFYQPKKVLIDPNVLKTLTKRHISNGMAEAFKMALTSDLDLYNVFKDKDPFNEIDKIIELSLKIKAKIVVEDEKENGIRKILNFGHTLGHGIEAVEELNGMYHGECVALGMIPMCNEKIRDDVITILNKLNLPTKIDGDDVKIKNILSAATHDKKCDGQDISVIMVDNPGNYIINKLPIEQWKNEIYQILSGLR